MYRIGFGNDIHRLETGWPLIIGGIRIEAEFGAVGHSDADVLTHAVTDSIFGALALGDIGSHFSDGEERWKNAESLIFLRFAVGEMKRLGYRLGNVDATVDLQRPKLRPYIDRIRESLAVALEVAEDRVSIKAKTGEGLGPVGEGIAVTAEAVVLLERIGQRDR